MKLIADINERLQVLSRPTMGGLKGNEEAGKETIVDKRVVHLDSSRLLSYFTKERKIVVIEKGLMRWLFS